MRQSDVTGRLLEATTEPRSRTGAAATQAATAGCHQQADESGRSTRRARRVRTTAARARAARSIASFRPGAFDKVDRAGAAKRARRDRAAQAAPAASLPGRHAGTRTGCRFKIYLRPSGPKQAEDASHGKRDMGLSKRGIGHSLRAMGQAARGHGPRDPRPSAAGLSRLRLSTASRYERPTRLCAARSQSRLASDRSPPRRGRAPRPRRTRARPRPAASSEISPPNTRICQLHHDSSSASPPAMTRPAAGRCC
jgi:hypothetical protein